MAKLKPKESPALGRDAWIEAGLHALSEGGVEAVRVEALARTLGVTKGSFYWHFTDRRELLLAMAEQWELASTTSVIAAVEARGGTGAARLLRLISLCFRGGEIDRLESALRRWGSSDEGVRPVLARIDATRLEYVAGLLVEHGLPLATARARSRLLYLTMIGEFTWTSHGGTPTPRRTLETLGEMMLALEA
jgi:AcrR family transcriptional regulator